MNLTTRFKRQILQGKLPALTDDDEQLYPGQVVEIERYYVWIIVTRPRKDGTWAYIVRDDRPRLLGKVTGETHIPSRAIGSGTNIEAGNLWAEPERIDKSTEDAIAKAAEDPNADLRKGRRMNPEGLTAAELAHEKGSLEARIGIARKVAEIRKVDISKHTRVIEDRLKRINRLIEDGDASVTTQGGSDD